MGWLAGWARRKSHVIDQKVGAGINYQVGIKVYKGAGVDGTEVVNGITFGKVYCGGNCQNDFGDIRFTASDGTTLWDYWMEELSAGIYALFWVELRDNLSLGNVTFYMYYDTPGASATTSDGDATFRLFDHFDDEAIDPAKWDVGGVGTAVETGTELTITAGAVFLNHKYVTSDVVYATGVRVLAKIKFTYVSSAAWWGMTTIVGSSADAPQTYNRKGAEATFNWGSGDGVNSSWLQYVKAKDVAYHIWQVCRTGTDDRLFVDSEENAGLEFPTAIDRYVTFNAFRSAGQGICVVDWVAVTKYIDPEPAHGAWGSEEIWGIRRFQEEGTDFRETKFGASWV